MADVDQLAVAGFVLGLLGLSYVVAVAAVASRYLLPATAAYLVVAAALLGRVLSRKENT